MKVNAFLVCTERYKQLCQKFSSKWSVKCTRHRIVYVARRSCRQPGKRASSWRHGKIKIKIISAKRLFRISTLTLGKFFRVWSGVGEPGVNQQMITPASTIKEQKKETKEHEGHVPRKGKRAKQLKNVKQDDNCTCPYYCPGHGPGKHTWQSRTLWEGNQTSFIERKTPPRGKTTPACPHG